MSVSGIQGQLLDVTVVACNKLKDTEWISRQDPYVVLEYGTTKLRTRTCTDGHKNPTFQEKFVVTLIEGLRELSVTVWNSNTLTYDDFIGSGKIQLQKVLSQGYDDNSWTLQTKTGRYAGEIRLILHYASHNKPAATHSASAPPYMAPQPLYHPPPTSISGYPPPVTAYSAPPSYPPSYPPSSVAYPQPGAAPYPPSAYPPQNPSAYPGSPYPPPPSAYPPSMYPPPPHGSSHYPPGPYPGAYPPPPPPYY